MGWDPETFWGSTLHSFYRFGFGYRKNQDAEDERMRARMSWLMWAAGVTWKEGTSPLTLYEMMKPKTEPEVESPVVMFKKKWFEQHGLSMEDAWLQ